MRARWFLLFLPFAASAQNTPELREIINRLDRLEKQNQALVEEVRGLRQQLAQRDAKPESPPPPQAAAEQPPLEERVAVAESRIDEHEQSKVASEHKLPITLTGTVLFNTFLNGRNSGDQYPTTAALNAAPPTDGGGFRQTILGARFDGPTIAGGGKVSGSLFLDLYGSTGGLINTTPRLRIASLDVAWTNTTFTLGYDKPILSPREPESLAQMAFSPLTGAGNLWLWMPQAKVEQRFHFGDQAGLDAQVGLYQTSETGTGLPTTLTFDRARPGYEGRFNLWGNLGDHSRIEIAPGFHASDTHAAFTSVPSRIFSLDWMIRPASRFDFTGAFFSGKNVGVLGGLRQGVTVFPDTRLQPIESKGGWGQLSYRATPRLTLNVYSGLEDDRNADLLRGNIARNLVYAGNFMYRLGPNVIASFEASQTRTTYLGIGTRINPHYDIALAYMF